MKTQGKFSRKQKRKELRKGKKARKHEFFTNKGRKPNAQPPKKLKKPQKERNLWEERECEIMKEKKQREQLEKDIKKSRVAKLKEDNNAEDREIRHLEKQLGLKKRSQKSISKFFAADGLDYLLDVCDGSKLKNMTKLENGLETDEDNEDNEKEEILNYTEVEEDEESNNEDEDSSIKDDEESFKDEEESVEEDEGSVKEEDEDVEEEVEGNVEKTKETWEDIYGRLRDGKGNIVESYKPPQLRGEKISSESLIRLKKQLKGLLNRLAENNLASISGQIETLYLNHSRNEANETLWGLFEESLISSTATPERLIAEHAMLITVLSANIGNEISAHCVQYCVTRWHELFVHRPEVEDKRVNNALLLLSYLYHFKLFHCTLLYDILEKITIELEEKEIELVLLVLKTVGFSLRKDDPFRLKNFVIKIQNLANEKKVSLGDGSRVAYMLEIVLAIKNNNMTKIPNYNPDYLEHLRKIVRTFIRKGNYAAELKIHLEDILKADERGRWWVVGSAWTGFLPGETNSNVENNVQNVKPLKRKADGFSAQLLKLAKKQRMNTDSRRNIFCIIMSSEDYLDAFEKLAKLGLKGPSEREIMNVLLHCVLAEKDFNPYYLHLAKKFCLCDRRFQIQLQFAVWDRIQELRSLSTTKIGNLARFLAHLILDKCLAISVLKVVQFAQLDKLSLCLMRKTLETILLADNEEAVASVFSRIAHSKPLRVFREGLRLFLNHFVLRNNNQLEQRVRLADSALNSTFDGTLLTA